MSHPGCRDTKGEAHNHSIVHQRSGISTSDLDVILEGHSERPQNATLVSLCPCGPNYKKDSSSIGPSSISSSSKMDTSHDLVAKNRRKYHQNLRIWNQTLASPHVPQSISEHTLVLPELFRVCQNPSKVSRSWFWISVLRMSFLRIVQN